MMILMKCVWSVDFFSTAMGSRVEGQFAFEVEGNGAGEPYVGEGVASGLEIDFEISSARGK